MLSSRSVFRNLDDPFGWRCVWDGYTVDGAFGESKAPRSVENAAVREVVVYGSAVGLDGVSPGGADGAEAEDVDRRLE